MRKRGLLFFLHDLRNLGSDNRMTLKKKTACGKKLLIWENKLFWFVHVGSLSFISRLQNPFDQNLLSLHELRHCHLVERKTMFSSAVPSLRWFFFINKMSFPLVYSWEFYIPSRHILFLPLYRWKHLSNSQCSSGHETYWSKATQKNKPINKSNLTDFKPICKLSFLSHLLEKKVFI